jgi:hypothetical protein
MMLFLPTTFHEDPYQLGRLRMRCADRVLCGGAKKSPLIRFEKGQPKDDIAKEYG